MNDTTQQEINKIWQRDYVSNVGVVTILTPPKRMATGLRYPYEYEVTERKVMRMVRDLKDMGRLIGDQFQCFLIENKMIRYGVRLHIFLLGHPTGWAGMTSTGVDAQCWDLSTLSISNRLASVFGSVPMYVEPWSATQKFQARFETYIKFKGRQ
jgi:hypothetical protein